MNYPAWITLMPTVTQAMIDADCHDPGNCPGAKAIKASLLHTSLEDYTPLVGQHVASLHAPRIFNQATGPMYRASDDEYPNELFDFVRKYDYTGLDRAVRGRVQPFIFTIKFRRMHAGSRSEAAWNAHLRDV